MHSTYKYKRHQELLSNLKNIQASFTEACPCPGDWQRKGEHSYRIFRTYSRHGWCPCENEGGALASIQSEESDFVLSLIPLRRTRLGSAENKFKFWMEDRTPFN